MALWQSFIIYLLLILNLILNYVTTSESSGNSSLTMVLDPVDEEEKNAQAIFSWAISTQGYFYLVIGIYS